MIKYTLYGEENPGEWLILLHGIGGNSSIWYKQLSMLRRRFKVMAIDLPSHGISKDIESDEWNLSMCVCEVRKAIEEKGIVKYHLMGVSLGTLIIHELLKTESNNILSCVLSGAVIKFNRKGKILLTVTEVLKDFIRFKHLYWILAHILMPMKNHKESRLAFIEEAKKVKETEFLKWYNLLGEVEKVYTDECKTSVPKLYISGSQDYMFLKNVKLNIKDDYFSKFVKINRSGHVCNIDQSKEFNYIISEFYEKL